MKVLDASFLIDYLDGVAATVEYLNANEQHEFVVPAPAYAEVLAGAGNYPDGDVTEVEAGLAWTDVYEVDRRTARLAGEVTAEIPDGGPHLDGIDAVVAAVGRELDAPVVSGDEDLTHSATRQVVSVDTY